MARSGGRIRGWVRASAFHKEGTSAQGALVCAAHEPEAEAIPKKACTTLAIRGLPMGGGGHHHGAAPGEELIAQVHEGVVIRLHMGMDSQHPWSGAALGRQTFRSVRSREQAHI
eukprot:1177620-Prorocentrum_minimum.AAC.8